MGRRILVAADIIRTVALAPTQQNVLILGLLVVIRTFLSWGVGGRDRGALALAITSRRAHLAAEPTDKE